MFKWNNLFNRKSSRDFPSFWKDYLRLFQATPEKNQGRLVAFDTETTGLLPKKDDMLSIGAVAFRENTIMISDSYEVYIQNYSDKGVESIPIHGIVSNHIHALTISDAIEGFVQYIGNGILVGHNVGFDVAMINEGLKKMGIKGKLKNKTMDTAKMAIRLDHGSHPSQVYAKDYSLDRLCKRFNIALHDRHNAAGDAYLTALIFLRLRPLLAERGVSMVM